MVGKISIGSILCMLLSGVPHYGFNQTKISLNSDQTAVNWRLTPQSEIGADSTKIYAEGFNTSNWVKALVPGAVFTAYVEAGLEKDPNWGDNIYKVDKKKYDRNFWYRTEFATPVSEGGKIWLNFEGVNRRAEIL